jgi:hypothetical protein
MTDFDTFFDFENTDNFLNSISGGLQELSPSSISDESVKHLSPNNFQIDVDPNMSNPDYNVNGGQDNGSNYFNPPNADETLFQQSNSISSYSNELTPISHPASSSTHTSPYDPVKKEFPDIENVLSRDALSDDILNQTGYSNDVKNEFLDDIRPKINDSISDEVLNTIPKQELKTTTAKKSAKVVKPKKDKNSHNMIEKKYRTNINSKILALRDAVPSLRIAAGSKDISVADLEGLIPASKLNKASVLTKATEYIKHLENKNNILKQQNLELQKLINRANAQPLQQNQGMNNNLPTDMSPNTVSTSSSNSQPRFGFYPQDNFNVTYAPMNYGNSNPSYQSAPMQTAGNQLNTNKMLMGGMAAVMGTSLFAGGNNDFKGLSALPFASYFPRFLTHPSGVSIQLWNLLKGLLLVATVFNLVFPYFKKSSKVKKSKENTSSQSILHTWISVNLGFQLPTEVDNNKTQEIVNRLMGGVPSTTELIQDYLFLSSSSINFENCLLNLIVGNILIHRYPFFNFFINNNLAIRGSLILNLEYDGENKSLIKLNKLIRKVDGLSFLGSKSLFSRMINVSHNRPINFGINDGQNHLRYVEFFEENKQDYYAVLFSWRVLEIIHQLNLKYLEILNDEQLQDEIKDIRSDLSIVSLLVDENTKLGNYFQLFKSIVNFNESPLLLKSMKTKIDTQLKAFNLIVNGQELTDEEPLYSDDDDESEVQPEPKYSDDLKLKSSKTLISSLNLISQEEFVVLTSSLIVYYYKNDEMSHAIKLLNYLRNLNGTDSLTLLAFTSLVTLINEVIPNIEDNEILDNLIKVTRAWLKESQASSFMDYKLVGSLTKSIVNKGMVLNGVEVTETDDE